MWILASFVIAVVAVLFAAQNSSIVTVQFLSYFFQQSLGVVILVGFVSGILASLLGYLPSFLRGHWRIRRYNRQISELESRLAAETGKRESLEKECTLLESRLAANTAPVGTGGTHGPGPIPGG